MTDLSLYFSSRAKYKALEILSEQSKPIPLRHLAYLAHLPVRSIELALIALVKDRIVQRRAHPRYSLFEMNHERTETHVLKDLFHFLRDRALEQRARCYDQKAVAALRFVTEANDLLRRSKRS